MKNLLIASILLSLFSIVGCSSEQSSDDQNAKEVSVSSDKEALDASIADLGWQRRAWREALSGHDV